LPRVSGWGIAPVGSILAPGTCPGACALVDLLAERFAGVPYWDRCLQDDQRPSP
jgi:hypothetical protein